MKKTFGIRPLPPHPRNKSSFVHFFRAYCISQSTSRTKDSRNSSSKTTAASAVHRSFHAASRLVATLSSSIKPSLHIFTASTPLHSNPCLHSIPIPTSLLLPPVIPSTLPLHHSSHKTDTKCHPPTPTPTPKPPSNAPSTPAPSSPPLPLPLPPLTPPLLFLLLILLLLLLLPPHP